jgi:hypothetical protein
MAARSRTSVLMAVVCASAVLCSSADAARPAAGGHYYGFEADESSPFDFLEVGAELRVTDSRRRLGRGSYVALGGECRGNRSFGHTVRLARAAISRRGRFSLTGTTGGRRYRIQGRFLNRGYARITYTVSRCRVSRFPVTLYLNGERPFSSCRKHKAETLASSPVARVFEQYRLEPAGFFPYVYGCVYAGGGRSPVLLGRNYDEELIEHPQVVGAVVAYASVGCGIGCTAAIVEQRLDFPGPPVLRLPAVLGGLSYNAVESLALKVNGSLAWLASRAGGPPGDIGPARREVYAVDSHGWRLVDSGPDIAPKSLTFDAASSVISWVNAGTARTAPLD